MSDGAPGEAPDPDFVVIRKKSGPPRAIDDNAASIREWRRFHLPKREWIVAGIGYPEPGQQIYRECEFCGEAIGAAAFTLAHRHESRDLVTCRLCRVSLTGPKPTPGVIVLSTPDARGLALENERNARRDKARRSSQRVELAVARNWSRSGNGALRYHPPGVDPGYFNSLFRFVGDAGWLWEAWFADSTHRDGGPHSTLKAATEAMLEDYMHWQRA